MSPRPPTDSLECLGPELEAQADFQIKKKNFFFFVSFGGLGVSICEKGEVSGLQGFLFANFFFHILILQGLLSTGDPNQVRKDGDFCAGWGGRLHM